MHVAFVLDEPKRFGYNCLTMTNANNAAPARAALWMSMSSGWTMVTEGALAAIQTAYRNAMTNGKDAAAMRIMPVGQVPA